MFQFCQMSTSGLCLNPNEIGIKFEVQVITNPTMSIQVQFNRKISTCSKWVGCHLVALCINRFMYGYWFTNMLIISYQNADFTNQQFVFPWFAACKINWCGIHVFPLLSGFLQIKEVNHLVINAKIDLIPWLRTMQDLKLSTHHWHSL